ncbi:MAG: SAM-dependent chlorinase/fluorinase, partial [Sedimentisphaerales bacterium]|nr:SAM-dependent chlorinase/fluorinase [Sedimentisphaerales bacterium]
MRKLSVPTRTSILTCLIEGKSVNSTSRICGVSKLTVLRLLADVGKVCAELHDRMVRNLATKRAQVDEIWSFVGCKENSKKNGKLGDGDCWTFCGIDADSKLVISYLVGLREVEYVKTFIQDIAKRIKDRIQLTSDGYKPYIKAVRGAFGWDGIDFAQLLKLYGKDTNRTNEARYSPSQCIGTLVRPLLNDPDKNHISTSYSERLNLTTRMTNRRFTRLTNAFSKRWRNHEHAIALHYFHYNFCRKHLSLGMTPAMAAGLAVKPWTIETIVALLVGREEQNKGCGRINREDRTWSESEPLPDSAMIVLMTDFGFGEYVGVMKGVIFSIDPDARLVDLCHDIRPQSIVEASWILSHNFAYFPPGSTFC